MAKRIIFSILLFISLFFLPFWVFIILSLVGMFLFLDYYEALFLLFFADMLYGTRENRYFNFVYIYSIFGLILFFTINFIKQKIRFNK